MKDGHGHAVVRVVGERDSGERPAYVIHGESKNTMPTKKIAADRHFPIARTLWVDALPPSGEEVIVIPRFAMTIEAIFKSPTRARFTYEIRTGLTRRRVRWMGRSVVLGDDVCDLLVTNTGTVEGSCRIVFGLSL